MKILILSIEILSCSIDFLTFSIYFSKKYWFPLEIMIFRLFWDFEPSWTLLELLEPSRTSLKRWTCASDSIPRPYDLNDFWAQGLTRHISLSEDLLKTHQKSKPRTYDFDDFLAWELCELTYHLDKHLKGKWKLMLILCYFNVFQSLGFMRSSVKVWSVKPSRTFEELKSQWYPEVCFMRGVRAYIYIYIYDNRQEPPLLVETSCVAENAWGKFEASNCVFRTFCFPQKRSPSAKLREGYAKGSAKLISRRELHLRKAGIREGAQRVREG